MKIQIKPDQHPAFLKSIQQAETVSQTSKTVIQALGAVLITAKLGSISIQANNLEQAIVASVPATVTAPGQVGISAKDLSRITKLGKSLEIEVTKNEAVIKGGGMFRLPIIAPEEFPKLPEMGDDEKEYEFTESEMASMLACGYAASSNDTRYVLQGVCFNPAGKQGIASDGRRMALSFFPMADDGFGPIMPSAACRILEALIQGAGDLKASFSAAHASATIGAVTFFTRLVEGNFPNVKKAMPTSDFAVKINRKNLISGIDRVLIAQSDHNRVKLTFSKSDLLLAIVGKNALAEASVDLNEKAPAKAVNFAITVDSGFLKEAAASMSTEEVSLEFTDNISPLAMRGNSYAIIMSMRTA